MFGELRIAPCGRVQGVVGVEAGKAAGPEPGFVPPSATQMLSGRLPTWVLAPAGAWGCKKGVPGECADSSGQCCVGG